MNELAKAIWYRAAFQAYLKEYGLSEVPGRRFYWMTSVVAAMGRDNVPYCP